VCDQLHAPTAVSEWQTLLSVGWEAGLTPCPTRMLWAALKKSVRAPGAQPARYTNSKISVLCTVTRLRAWQSVVRIPAEERDYSLLKTSRPPNLLISVYRGSFPMSKASRAWCLTTHLRIGPRLRISGATPPLPPYAFTARTRRHYLLSLLIQRNDIYSRTRL
jgi:hypothetical protein